MFENNDIGDYETITQQLWQNNDSCPEGTIPIRRTTKHDILRADSIERFGKKSPESIPRSKSATRSVLNNSQGHEHAIGYVENDTYNGARASINVWQPQIEEPIEFSLSQIWIVGGDFDSNLNTIEVGWHVLPQMYGDKQTRLFTYWTRDNYQSTGCYNLLCSGFVQVNKNAVLGGAIAPFSSYSGPQYEIAIFVWKEPKDGNWWLQLGNDQVIGYWPASLFTHLIDSANMVQWGGEVINTKPNGMHTTTQMGSGHFPEEGRGKASFFRNLQILDGFNTPRDVKGLRSFVDVKTGCYNMKIRDDGNEFYYGGPGKNENCP